MKDHVIENIVKECPKKKTKQSENFVKKELKIQREIPDNKSFLIALDWYLTIQSNFLYHMVS